MGRALKSFAFSLPFKKAGEEPKAWRKLSLKLTKAIFFSVSLIFAFRACGMSVTEEWAQSICLGCDIIMVDDMTYCSEACRLKDLHRSPTSFEVQSYQHYSTLFSLPNSLNIYTNHHYQGYKLLKRHISYALKGSTASFSSASSTSCFGRDFSPSAWTKETWQIEHKATIAKAGFSKHRNPTREAASGSYISPTTTNGTPLTGWCAWTSSKRLELGAEDLYFTECSIPIDEDQVHPTAVLPKGGRK